MSVQPNATKSTENKLMQPRFIQVKADVFVNLNHVTDVALRQDKTLIISLVNHDNETYIVVNDHFVEPFMRAIARYAVPTSIIP